MIFLKQADEDISLEELSIFISSLPSEACVSYSNTDYEFTEERHPTDPIKLGVMTLRFTESYLYSVGSMSSQVLFANVLSNRVCRYVFKLHKDSNIKSPTGAEYEYHEHSDTELKKARAVQLARDTTKNLCSYDYMTWVLHDETLDKDTVVAIDDVIFDSECFRSIKALIFDWQYQKALDLVTEKYHMVKTLKDPQGKPMLPKLEQLEGDSNVVSD